MIVIFQNNSKDNHNNGNNNNIVLLLFRYHRPITINDSNIYISSNNDFENND